MKRYAVGFLGAGAGVILLNPVGNYPPGGVADGAPLPEALRRRQAPDDFHLLRIDFRDAALDQRSYFRRNHRLANYIVAAGLSPAEGDLAPGFLKGSFDNAHVAVKIILPGPGPKTARPYNLLDASDQLLAGQKVLVPENIQ